MTALLSTAAVQACGIALMVTWPNIFSSCTSQEIPGSGLLGMSRLEPTTAFPCAGRLGGLIGTRHDMQQPRHLGCCYSGVPICQCLQLMCWACSQAPICNSHGCQCASAAGHAAPVAPLFLGCICSLSGRFPRGVTPRMSMT